MTPSPARRPALLVHSGGFGGRQWRKLGELLAPTHDVIAPDLIGYGSEPWPAGKPFHFRQDVERLAAMLDERLAAGDGRQAERDGRQAERDGRQAEREQRQAERDQRQAERDQRHADRDRGQADVVGHSYGGFLALQLALARPDLVRRVAVYDPVAFNVLTADERAAGFVGVKGTYELPVDEAWLAAFVDWWNGPGAWTKLPEPTRAAFRQVGWKMSQEVATLMADRESDYARVRAPVLVLGGGRSPEAERMTVARLARVVPGAELHMFDDLGHMGPIVDAERVNAAIALSLRR